MDGDLIEVVNRLQASEYSLLQPIVPKYRQRRANAAREQTGGCSLGAVERGRAEAAWRAYIFLYTLLTYFATAFSQVGGDAVDLPQIVTVCVPLRWPFRLGARC